VYNEYYGLIRAPFEMTPDPSFLYMGEAHRERERADAAEELA